MKILVLVLFWAGVALGEGQCPENIKYKNGSYLKRGANFYYQNSSFLLRDGNVYYPNGSFLKRDANIYYSNGSYLQRDNNLYYPNGSFLKRDDNYYYANGSYFKRDANFLYPNGSYARRNGKLYREDGTETVFPIVLSTEIGDVGLLRAEVASQTENVDVDFKDMVVDADGARINVLWTGTSFSNFEILLNTGVPNEDVFVQMTPTAVSCFLAGSGPVTPVFTLLSPAATIDVRVAPGFDPRKVRQALQNTLDSLHLVK